MAVRLVCRACGKRLKFPDGADPNAAARCPKCGARVDLSAALEASAYLPSVALPNGTAPRNPPLLGHDDPLPSPAGRAGPPRPTPLPKSGGRAGAAPPPPASGAGTAAGSLSLDDDDEQDGPTADTPFRVPVRVLADSLQQIVGPCSAVFVSHGLFLEREPMKPFLYVPVGCRAESLRDGTLLVALPDRRTVALRFRGAAQRPLARDARAFLLGERPAPFAAEYRRKWWILWAALIFALGVAVGPVVLARTANLGLEFGLQVAAGFAVAGLVGNAAVALVSRRSVPGQLVMMAGVCAVLTGVFLFGAAAYLAGRQRGIDETKVDPQPPPPEPAAPDPVPSAPPPPAAPQVPPTHVGRATANGVSALDDGPADVTALTMAPDGTTLGIGYADGTTRLCLLDQPTFEPLLPGPKADGPVNRVRFDGTSRFVFALTPAGTVAATRAGPFQTFAKIPGAPVAIAPELAADRVRFAAVRGNTIQYRSLPIAFIQRPPVKAKDKGVAYAFPGKGDETVPPNSGPDPAKPGGAAGPTFLAWGPGGKLFAGQPDGAIAIWSNALRAEPPSRDHKAAVRAWADCAGTGDFATGDDQGVVAWWPSKGGKPTLAPVFTPPAPVAVLAVAPSGTRLAAADNTGRLVVWDVTAGKAVRHSKRPTPVKAMAFGPNDDVVILGVGKSVEVWWVPKLAE